MDIIRTMSNHGMISGGKGDTTPPTPPTLGDVTATADSITVNWTLPRDGDMAYAVVKVNGGERYRGLGKTTTITGLAEQTQYLVEVVTVDYAGNQSAPASTYVTTLSAIKVYGFRIDHSVSDPRQAVTYIEDAVGFTPATKTGGDGDINLGSWADKFPFNKIRPVERSGAIIVAEVNKNNFGIRTDGNSVSGTNEIMIEIPPVYIKIRKITEDIHEYRFSDVQIDSGYRALAHERGANNVKGNLYVGAYEGCADGVRIGSRSGKSVLVNETIGAMRTRATNNGNGYNLCTPHTYSLFKVLFVAMFKSLDSQTALGHGFVNASAPTTTGRCRTHGMYSGSPTAGGDSMKFMGVENLWGNAAEFIDGCFVDQSSYLIKTTDQAIFNDTGAGYPYSAQGAHLGGYMTKPIVSSYATFFPIVCGGTETTYYCDNTDCFGGIPRHGRRYLDGAGAGIFSIVGFTADSVSTNTGARLMYLAP